MHPTSLHSPSRTLSYNQPPLLEETLAFSPPALSEESANSPIYTPANFVKSSLQSYVDLCHSLPPIPEILKKELMDWLDQTVLLKWEAPQGWEALSFSLFATVRSLISRSGYEPYLRGGALTHWILNSPLYKEAVFDQLDLPPAMRETLVEAMRWIPQAKPPADIDIHYQVEGDLVQFHEELVEYLADMWRKIAAQKNLGEMLQNYYLAHRKRTHNFSSHSPSADELSRWFMRSTLFKSGGICSSDLHLEVCRLHADCAPHRYQEQLVLPLEFIAVHRLGRERLWQSDFKLPLQSLLDSQNERELQPVLQNSANVTAYWPALLDLLSGELKLVDGPDLELRDLHRLLLPLTYGLNIPHVESIHPFTRPIAAGKYAISALEEKLTEICSRLDHPQARLMLLMNAAYILKDHTTTKDFDRIARNLLSGWRITSPLFTLIETALCEGWEFHTALHLIALSCLTSLGEGDISFALHAGVWSLALRYAPHTVWIPLDSLQSAVSDLRSPSLSLLEKIENLLPDVQLPCQATWPEMPLLASNLQAISRFFPNTTFGNRLLTLALRRDPYLVLIAEDLEQLLALNFQPSKARTKILWQDINNLSLNPALEYLTPPQKSHPAHTTPEERTALWVESFSLSPIEKQRRFAMELACNSKAQQPLTIATRNLLICSPKLAIETLHVGHNLGKWPRNYSWSLFFAQIAQLTPEKRAALKEFHQKLAIALYQSNHRDIIAGMKNALSSTNAIPLKTLMPRLFYTCSLLTFLHDDEVTEIFTETSGQLIQKTNASGLISPKEHLTLHLKPFVEKIQEGKLSFRQAFSLFHLCGFLESLSGSSDQAQELLHHAGIAIQTALHPAIEQLCMPPSPVLMLLKPHIARLRITDTCISQIKKAQNLTSVAQALATAATLTENLLFKCRLNALALLCNPLMYEGFDATLLAMAGTEQLLLEPWKIIKNELLAVLKQAKNPPKQWLQLATFLEHSQEAPKTEAWIAWLRRVGLNRLAEELMQSRSAENESQAASRARQLIDVNLFDGIAEIEKSLQAGDLSPKELWALTPRLNAALGSTISPILLRLLASIRNHYPAPNRKALTENQLTERDRASLSLFLSARADDCELIFETVDFLCLNGRLPIVDYTKETWTLLALRTLKTSFTRSLELWRISPMRYQLSPDQKNIYHQQLLECVQASPLLSIGALEEFVRYLYLLGDSIDRAFKTQFTEILLFNLYHQLDVKNYAWPFFAQACALLSNLDLPKLLAYAAHLVGSNPSPKLIEWISKHCPTTLPEFDLKGLVVQMLTYLHASNPYNEAIIKWVLSDFLKKLFIPSEDEAFLCQLLPLMAHIDHLKTSTKKQLLHTALMAINVSRSPLLHKELYSVVAKALAVHHLASKELLEGLQTMTNHPFLLALLEAAIVAIDLPLFEHWIATPFLELSDCEERSQLALRMAKQLLEKDRAKEITALTTYFPVNTADTVQLVQRGAKHLFKNQLYVACGELLIQAKGVVPHQETLLKMVKRVMRSISHLKGSSRLLVNLMEAYPESLRNYQLFTSCMQICLADKTARKELKSAILSLRCHAQAYFSDPLALKSRLLADLSLAGAFYDQPLPIALSCLQTLAYFQHSTEDLRTNWLDISAWLAENPFSSSEEPRGASDYPGDEPLRELQVALQGLCSEPLFLSALDAVVQSLCQASFTRGSVEERGLLLFWDLANNLQIDKGLLLLLAIRLHKKNTPKMLQRAYLLFDEIIVQWSESGSRLHKQRSVASALEMLYLLATSSEVESFISFRRYMEDPRVQEEVGKEDMAKLWDSHLTHAATTPSPSIYKTCELFNQLLRHASLLTTEILKNCGTIPNCFIPILQRILSTALSIKELDIAFQQIEQFLKLLPHPLYTGSISALKKDLPLTLYCSLLTNELHLTRTHPLQDQIFMDVESKITPLLTAFPQLSDASQKYLSTLFFIYLETRFLSLDINDADQVFLKIPLVQRILKDNNFINKNLKSYIHLLYSYKKRAWNKKSIPFLFETIERLAKRKSKIAIYHMVYMLDRASKELDVSDRTALFPSLKLLIDLLPLAPFDKWFHDSQSGFDKHIVTVVNDIVMSSLGSKTSKELLKRLTDQMDVICAPWNKLHESRMQGLHIIDHNFIESTAIEKILCSLIKHKILDVIQKRDTLLQAVKIIHQFLPVLTETFIVHYGCIQLPQLVEQIELNNDTPSTPLRWLSILRALNGWKNSDIQIAYMELTSDWIIRLAQFSIKLATDCLHVALREQVYVGDNKQTFLSKIHREIQNKKSYFDSSPLYTQLPLYNNTLREMNVNPQILLKEPPPKGTYELRKKKALLAMPHPTYE